MYNVDFASSKEKLSSFHTLITSVMELRFTVLAGHVPTAFSCTHDPLHTSAAPPQLINILVWWVETPCHHLLCQWKSIKNNTHLHLWVQSPLVFPLYQWWVLSYQSTHKEWRQKVWGQRDTNLKQNGIISASVGETMPVDFKIPSLKCIKRGKKCTNYPNLKPVNQNEYSVMYI